MKHPHILIGAGCLSVFSIGAGLALAQQGSSPVTGGLAGIEPAGIVPADDGPAGIDPAAMDAGPADDGPGGVGPEDFGPEDFGPADGGPVDFEPAYVRPLELRPANVRPAYARPAAVRPPDGGPIEGGPVLTFGISSTLSATDNYSLLPDGGDSAELFDIGLSFGYIDRRATDVLSFGYEGLLHAIEPPDTTNRLDNQHARLGYELEGVNSRLSLGADYDFSSVDTLDPFDYDEFFEDDPLDENDLSQSQGNRQQIAARFSYETGLTDPLGFILSGRYRDRTYYDTTNTDLYDHQIFNLAGTARLTVSPVTETRLTLGYEDYDADDIPQTDRRTSSVSVGLSQALSPIDFLNASVGYEEIETTETNLGTRQTDTEGGVIGSLGLSRNLKRGTIGTTLDLRQSEEGQIVTWLVNRSLLLPRGAIEVSVGASTDVDDTIRPVGSVNFIHEMLRSTFTAALSQQVSISTESNDLLTTAASLGYTYEINSLSNLNFSANYAAYSQDGGSASGDPVRTDLRAVYSRALTRDWQMSSGYEYRVREETGVGTATSNRVFLTLQRDFVLRP